MHARHWKIQRAGENATVNQTNHSFVVGVENGMRRLFFEWFVAALEYWAPRVGDTFHASLATLRLKKSFNDVCGHWLAGRHTSASGHPFNPSSKRTRRRCSTGKPYAIRCVHPAEKIAVERLLPRVLPSAAAAIATRWIIRGPARRYGEALRHWARSTTSPLTVPGRSPSADWREQWTE